MAYKRWRDVWVKGMVSQTAWGYFQTVCNKQGVRVAEVAVPAGKTDDLDLILAAPRLLNACKMMTQAMARYRDFGEPYDHDEGMLNAILEIKKGARLFQGTKHRKGGTIPEGEGGMK